ncbi:MAG: exopolyphosphatase [Defluviitaleaceae bacterium]|nr:exopolyphosphatase [Defluviitaleaceae bacterium]
MRLITRADFDGLTCGAILLELGVIDSWKYVHPKDLQDGKIEVTENDLLANVPYVEGCGMWFDHHSSELTRVGSDIAVEGARYAASSAARIIYEYYGGVSRLPYLEEMIDAVDKVDSANLTVDEVIHPTGWILLGFIMDPRTGLGRHHQFTVSNWELMEELMDACRDYEIDEIMMMPNVAERIEYYHKQSEEFRNMLLKYTRSEDDVIITDLRGVSPIYTGNRFILYSLFPDQNISIWVVAGIAGNNMIAVGHSILNRSSGVNVGEMMSQYGGGGHMQVGTCQVLEDDTDDVIDTLVKAINGVPRKALEG